MSLMDEARDELMQLLEANYDGPLHEVESWDAWRRRNADAILTAGYRKPEAAPPVKAFDTSREPVKNGAVSLYVEAAPSDTDQKARAEYFAQFRGEWPAPQPSTVTAEQVEAIVQSLADGGLDWDDCGREGIWGEEFYESVYSALDSAGFSRTSQPVQVEVTEPEWEYGRVNGEYITIPPAGIPHTHRRIKAVPAGEWEVAPAALGGGDQ